MHTQHTIYSDSGSKIICNSHIQSEHVDVVHTNKPSEEFTFNYTDFDGSMDVNYDESNSFANLDEHINEAPTKKTRTAPVDHSDQIKIGQTLLCTLVSF